MTATAPLAAQQLQIGGGGAIAEWFAQNIAPNIGAGLAGPVGSFCAVPQGVGGVGGASVFLKTGAGSNNAVGWTRQNLTNMKVFNVRAFGATGDGVTNDRVSIQNTINAAVAAGGGIVYFPKGTYAVYKVGAGLANIVSFDLSNVSNLVFMGDGYVSQLWQVGNAFGADWHLFSIRNFSNQIQFRDLYFDASRTSNTDPAGQQHTIRILGNPPDAANSGAFKIDVIGCFFDYQIGDHVNLGAGNGKPVHDNRVLYNAYNAVSIGPIGGAKYRSAVGFQTNVLRTLVGFNYSRGCSDQTIDYEPTSNGGINQGDILLGNQGDGQLHNSEVFSFAGVAHDDPILDTAWLYNIAFNGGSMIIGDASTSTLVGNIIVNQNNNPAAGAPVLFCQRTFDQMIIAGNVLVTTATALPRQALSLSADEFGFASNSVIVGNVMRTESADAGASFESARGILFEGNVCTVIGDDTVNGAVIVASSNLYPVDLVTIRHNIALGDPTGLARAPVKLSATFQKISNALVIGNYLRNSTPGGITSGVQWASSGGAGTYDQGHGSLDNLCIGGTNNSITYASINSMACAASCSGASGAQVALGNASGSSGPEAVLDAHVGSLCTNPPGSGDSAIMFYKETAPTTNTGWLRVGTTDIPFGCASSTTTTTALFMAPSSDLAVAGAVEIQFRLWKSGKVRNLRVAQKAGTGTGTSTYTVRRNGADTSLAVTFNFVLTSGSSATSVTGTAGDLISLKITKSQAPVTPPTGIVATVEIT